MRVARCEACRECAGCSHGAVPVVATHCCPLQCVHNERERRVQRASAQLLWRQQLRRPQEPACERACQQQLSVRVALPRPAPRRTTTAECGMQGWQRRARQAASACGSTVPCRATRRQLRQQPVQHSSLVVRQQVAVAAAASLATRGGSDPCDERQERQCISGGGGRQATALQQPGAAPRTDRCYTSRQELVLSSGGCRTGEPRRHCCGSCRRCAEQQRATDAVA